jgi:hypothetical protein
MPRRLGVLLLAASAMALLAGASRRRAVNPPTPLELDARRSFAVTDQVILDAFPFERVMNALVERSGTRTSALSLYRQMFDTQNPKPGLVSAEDAHCDDFLLDGRPSFNGLPRRCPTPEGILAKSNPFVGDHIPLALINRFDLAPADGSNCGQYRIVFARKTSSPFERLHLIFEAVLPNPTPSTGLEGCRVVAQFWADLSRINSIDERRAKLDAFFFTGLPGFAPVLDPGHFSAASGGGIRTMQNAQSPLQNRFYQFRLERKCERGECRLIADPDVLQNMPYGKFFDGSYETPAARRFRDAFVEEVRNLAIEDRNLFFMNIPREFLLVESNPGGSEVDTVFEIPFQLGQVTPEGRAFAQRISDELKKVGSTLSPREVVSRADQLSCAGCHFFQGNVGSTEFYQQISEAVIETGEAGPRFAVSSTMQNVFIPHRIDVLRTFLTSSAPPKGATVGGGRTIQ